MNRMIVCAAIRNQAGSVISGPRHYDAVMHQQIESSTQDWSSAAQGFVDQNGDYLTREEAYDVAAAAGQIIRRCGGDNGRLFSENLY